MRGLLFLTAALLPFVREARAEEKEKEPTAVIELGAAVERTFPVYRADLQLFIQPRA
jgi:hypothetical protein